MAPFLVDVTGNTPDLYDRVCGGMTRTMTRTMPSTSSTLCSGLGLLMRRALPVRWVLGWLTAGLGALLAIAWEAEW